MQPGDTNRPGFQPLGCGSICTQGFALGWYRGAPLALEAIRQVWIFGGVTTSGFSQTDPLPKAPFILQNWPGFQPLGCGSLCTQGFALGWYRNAPLALKAIRRYRNAPLALKAIRQYRNAPLALKAIRRYRSAPLALEAIRRVWIFGKRHNYELELLTMK